jgi:hypothetical protein
MIQETENLKSIYEKLFSSLTREPKPIIVRVEFYPYVGINNRIRLRDGLLHVKISDVLAVASIEFHHALAEILVKKLLKKKISTQSLEIFNEYIKQPATREKSLENRRTRGRKVISSSQGRVYNLEEIFNLLNGVYFQNLIPKPTLTWSATKTYRILGHHDAIHQTIVISKSLDDKKVPRFVVEYIVYHEMLHIKHPTQYANGRRYVHTPIFKRDEEEFAFFEEAESWIEKNVNALKKKANGRWKFFD